MRAGDDEVVSPSCSTALRIVFYNSITLFSIARCIDWLLCCIVRSGNITLLYCEIVVFECSFEKIAARDDIISSQLQKI